MTYTIAFIAQDGWHCLQSFEADSIDDAVKTAHELMAEYKGCYDLPVDLSISIGELTNPNERGEK